MVEGVQRMIESPTSQVLPTAAEGWTERLYEVSLAMLCVTGFDGYFKTVNPAWVATLGHSVEELLAVPASEFVHPDDQAFTLLESVAAAAGNNAAQFRNRYRHRDGSYRWLDWLAVTDPARQLIFASARDITVEKEAEAARVKVQNVLDAVYRSITDHAIYMIDPAGIVLSWSMGAESIKGWKAEEVIGQSFARFYNHVEVASDRPRLDLADALTNGSHRSEGWRTRKDGGSIWTEVTTSPVHGADGELLGFVNVVHDLSDSHGLELEMAALNQSLETRIKVEKAAEVARIKAQAVLDAVYRSITDHAIYMVDPAGIVLTWSLGAESVKGWREEEVIGKDFAMFYSAEEVAAERPRRDLEHSLAQGSHRSEGWRKRRDGGSIWTEVTTSPVHGADGELLGFVNVVHDMSESHRLQLEMTSFNETLEARISRRTADLTSAVSELESFAYTVSHDLRAPLRAMDGFSRILLEDQAHLLSEPAQRQLVRVRENAQQMGKLIDELLRFSRINRGPMERKEVDPADIARQVAHDLYGESDKPLPITVQPMPLCSAEPTLLRQVFANLIGNALKFSRDVKEPAIVVGCDTTQRPPAYFVRDNGVGFDMQYAGRLFGVFQRLHRAEDFEGTGVGLATVQRIVQRHGGRVWAESQPNLGATFHFTLEDPDVEL
jgi:PAS domain S-box-containing protein